MPPAPAQSASGIQWTYDFGSALNAARASNKKVLVFFSAEGNDAAGTYESRFFTHPAVRTAFSNFVLVKVDFPRNTRFAYTLGVFGAGTVVVTDASGDVTARITQLPASEADFVKEISAEKLKPIHTPAPTTSAANEETTDAAAQTTETEDAPATDPAAAPADAAPAPGAEAAPPADNMM